MQQHNLTCYVCGFLIEAADPYVVDVVTVKDGQHETDVRHSECDPSAPWQHRDGYDLVSEYELDDICAPV